MAKPGDGRRRRSRIEHLRLAALSHPQRQAILRLLLDDREADSGEIAAELEDDRGRIAYHLRVLVRCDALRVVARRRPAPPLYRWSPDANWARKMLGEIDEQGSEGA
jgi:DNA-binding transcriptional ArsR family regulator